MTDDSVEANSPSDIIGSNPRVIEPKTGWANAQPLPENMLQIHAKDPEFTHNDSNEKNSPGSVVGSNMKPVEAVTGWPNAQPTRPNMV